MHKEKMDILAAFENRKEKLTPRAERIAWLKTLPSLEQEDLLKLWHGLAFDHILFMDEDLKEIFRFQIAKKGGFKLVK